MKNGDRRILNNVLLWIYVLLLIYWENVTCCFIVSSLAVFGVCFGGGRALEIAAGSSYSTNTHIIPPFVRPKACVAWYPTRYNVHQLFGPNKSTLSAGNVAIMALFAENDILPGATIKDAEELKNILEKNYNDNIIDYMVKVYPNQEHGFAHQQEEIQQDLDDHDDEYDYFNNQSTTSSPEKESAFLLSTAWIETYTRLFLPTVGTPVKDEKINSKSSQWCTDLQMKELKDIYQNNERNIREEIQKEIDEHIIEDEDDFLLDYNDVSIQQW